MTSKAEKLLERMRRTKANWKRHDLDTLYEGFGFVLRNGSNHDVVSHPEFPQLSDTLPRHRKVPEYNVRKAIKHIDTLSKLRKINVSSEAESSD